MFANQARPMMNQPQPMRMAPQAQPAPQPTHWQNAAAPVPKPPAVVRGVAPEAPAKFVLPRPEALGVSTSLALQQPSPQAPVQVDWNQIQARMERLRVVRYNKVQQADGVHVTLLLPTGDPTMGQPFEARANNEAGAIQDALQQAEAWAQRRN